MAAFSGFRVTDSGKLKFLISPDQRRGFSAFAAIGIPAALLSPLYPRSLEQSAEEQGEDKTGLQAAYDYQLQTEEGEPYRAVKIEAPSEGKLTCRSGLNPAQGKLTGLVRAFESG